MIDQDADTLTLPQLAKRSGRSYTTFWERARRGDDVLPGVRAFKLGSHFYVTRAQYEQFLRTAGQPVEADQAEAEVEQERAS